MALPIHFCRKIATFGEMIQEKTQNFRVELRCSDPMWWQYNVTLIASGLNASGERCGYYATEDRQGDPAGGSARPAHSTTNRCTSLDCGPCHSLDLYLYVIPHRLPEPSEVEQTNPIEAHLVIRSETKTLLDEVMAINPWGGTTRHLKFGDQPAEKA